MDVPWSRPTVVIESHESPTCTASICFCEESHIISLVSMFNNNRMRRVLDDKINHSTISE